MIEATPINNTVKSDFGYSKRRMCILKDNFVTATIDIWDTAGKPLKHIEFTDIRPYGKVKPRWQAMKSMAENLQTQHMTQVIVNDFAAEKPCPISFSHRRVLRNDARCLLGFACCSSFMLLQHAYADDSEMSFVSQNSARLDVWSSDRDLSSLKTLGKQVSGPMVHSNLTLHLSCITT